VIKVTGAEGEPVPLQHLIYTRWFVPLASPMNASLLFALANLAVLFVVLWVMDRKGIYLKA
jgi:predicted acyltransferase